MHLDQVNLLALFIEVRKQLGLSQEGLARKLDVSFAMVNRWENAQTKPSHPEKEQLEALSYICPSTK